MTDSLSALADQTFSTLPAELVDSARLAWESIAPAIEPLAGNTQAREWIASLPRVLVASDFVAQAGRRNPGLMRELLDSGELYRPASSGELTLRIRAAADVATDEAALQRLLRQVRQREMVRLAWRDLAGQAELSEVLAALSELADSCIDVATSWLLQRLTADAGVPRTSAGAPLGLIVLALGKLGGHELNFSSDVDLIFAYPEEGEIEGTASLSHHEFFLRLCQALIRVLSEPTPDGFVFRVDTRLRPFGASGPLALSADAMEHYYQAHGREWERYALIKARVCAGDRIAGDELLARLRPFVYRRYLDYGALDSIREMKDMIAREVERKGMSTNIKLGAGGIREIEFIVQALQLIRAGREPMLQQRATLQALPRLVTAGYVAPTVADELTAAYTFLRRSEHRLQMVADQQTHALPLSEIERRRLALAMEFNDWDAYQAALERHRACVHAHFETLLGERATTVDTTEVYAALWSGVLEGEPALDPLRAAGYADPAALLALLKGLRESSVYRALSTEGRTRLDRLVPALLREAARTPDPNVTMSRLTQLLESIGRRSAYFALLTENPVALTQLVNLAAASPWIALWISQHPVLLDELLDPRELYALPTRADLEVELTERLATVTPEDAEAQMNILREFRNAHLLRVAAADIGPGLAPDRVGAHLAQLAEVVLAAALTLTVDALVARHGVPGGDANCPAPGFAVIGYGKLGSLELGYASDLDMIFLYDDVESGMTAGARSITNEQYFARVAQRLINLLTTRTAAGILYPVDARLRPSGNSGPLVTSLMAFRRYQQNQAWTWEHQALVRARPVAGDMRLADAFGAVRRDVLCQARDPHKLRQDVREMRARMAQAHAPAPDGFDVKHDRGGIVDIEFMVQYWILRWAHAHPDAVGHTDNINLLETLAGHGRIPAEQAQFLINTYRRYLSIEHRLKLMERGTRVALIELDGGPQRVLEIWRETFEQESNDDVDVRS